MHKHILIPLYMYAQCIYIQQRYLQYGLNLKMLHVQNMFKICAPIRIHIYAHIQLKCMCTYTHIRRCTYIHRTLQNILSLWKGNTNKCTYVCISPSSFPYRNEMQGDGERTGKLHANYTLYRTPIAQCTSAVNRNIPTIYVCLRPDHVISHNILYTWYPITFYTLVYLHKPCTDIHVHRSNTHIAIMIVLGFNDTSTLKGHFVSSPREREKRDRRGDEREGQGRKRNRNESEETEEIKTFPLYPYPLQG